MEYKPFSVAMSVYYKDNATFFDRALQSITEEQSILPDEIVLVCDGLLSEQLDAVVTKYNNKYPIFKVIRFAENKGLGNALKEAVKASSYELIARMDSDDISNPDRFEQQLSYFTSHPNVDIVGGDITEFIGEENNTIGRRMVPSEDAEIKEYMKKRCAMNHVSVMYKKTAVQSAGGYQNWYCNEDYYLWIRMQLNNAIFANTGTVLVNVRVGEEMYKRRGGKKYFQSEIGLQKYMIDHGVIGRGTYIGNWCKRFVVQMLMPDKMRGWIFKHFARHNISKVNSYRI